MYKYIQNISEDSATILLYDQIGSSIDEKGNICYGIDGSLFANEILYLQDKCKKINVRINSIGGSVLDGYSIVSAILNSKVPVDTYVDGLAASIAGVIAMAGRKCYIMDYGTLMIHNPSGGNDSKVLDLVKETLVTIFKNRTSLSEVEINAMMDKETWFDANTAKANGMCDEIVSSGKKIKMQTSESLYNMALIYNKIINPKKNMNKIFNSLKLEENSTEEKAVEAIESLNVKVEGLVNSLQEAATENEAVKAELEKANAKLAEVETEKANAEAAKIEEMVNSFNVKEEEKENIIALAKVNFEAVKNMLSKTTVKEPVKIFDIKNVVTPKGTEDRSTWTIRDWEKKDAKGLANIKNTTPETYEVMYNNFYKKQK